MSKHTEIARPSLALNVRISNLRPPDALKACAYGVWLGYCASIQLRSAAMPCPSVDAFTTSGWSQSMVSGRAPVGANTLACISTVAVAQAASRIKRPAAMTSRMQSSGSLGFNGLHLLQQPIERIG